MGNSTSKSWWYGWTMVGLLTVAITYCGALAILRSGDIGIRDKYGMYGPLSLHNGLLDWILACALSFAAVLALTLVVFVVPRLIVAGVLYFKNGSDASSLFLSYGYSLKEIRGMTASECAAKYLSIAASEAAS